MLPCTEEEVEALFYFIYNLYLTLYPIRTLSIPFPIFTAVHGVGVAQAKPACKHTIATRKCYQYNTIIFGTGSGEWTFSLGLSGVPGRGRNVSHHGMLHSSYIQYVSYTCTY